MSNRTNRKAVWTNAGVVVIAAVGMSAATYVFLPALFSVGEPPARTATVLVYFHKADHASCEATQAVARTIATSGDIADAALRELFRGPTALEEQMSLSSAFDSEVIARAYGTNIDDLGSYYRGVSVTDGIATVDFAPGALAYLNSAACLQQSVKTPIINTLEQFPKVQTVEFSIDGKLFTEWDA